MEPFHVMTHGVRVGPIRRLLGRLVALVVRWRVEARIPENLRKAVVIAAPHTSLWDGALIVALTWARGVRLSWMVKHSAYRWPLRSFMRFLGAVPVHRSAPKGVVGAMASQLRQADAMFLAVAPAGTRRKVRYWKSGFYRIAVEAGVPLVFGFLDYGRRLAGISEPFHPTGDIARDMEIVRAFYKDIQGCHPELMSSRRLREEDEPEKG